MAVEPLPSAQSADRAFSCLDQMKRIRAAPHTDDYKVGMDEESAMAGVVIVTSGQEVTAVFAQAPGALQLLPTQRYEPGWLSVLDADGRTVQQALPQADPYEEIYKRNDRWWALIKEEWLSPKDGEPLRWGQYVKFLGDAKAFHEEVTPNSYHPSTYAFYGADVKGATKSFEKIVWRMKRPAHPSDAPAPTPEVVYDRSAPQIDMDGVNPEYVDRKGVFVEVDPMTRRRSASVISQWELWAGMQDGRGDGTVPAQSGHAPTDSDKVRQVFRLTGVEHEPAFRESTTAQQVTVYAIGKIAREARVPKTAATTTQTKPST